MRAVVRHKMLRLVRDERGHGVRVRQAARRVQRARLRHHQSAAARTVTVTLYKSNSLIILTPLVYGI